jgi:DNA excision repair protein ERCC-4
MDHFGADIEIVVDDRELASEVPGWLGRREGLSIRISRLASADYSIRGVIGVERKTAVDFAKSLIDGRLFTQISALRHAYERPLLLLERFCPDGEIGGVSRHALSGALISLTTIFGVPVLFSSGPEDTAELIAAAGRQLVRSAGISYVRPGYRPKGWRRRALYILQGLPSVGPGRAQALLARFGSVGAALAADEKALANTHGIGVGVARSIRAALGEEPGRASADGPDALPIVDNRSA